jgi:hypothetical protein
MYSLFVAINFYYKFNNSPYSKNYVRTIYFVCYMLYYYT